MKTKHEILYPFKGRMYDFWAPPSFIKQFTKGSDADIDKAFDEIYAEHRVVTLPALIRRINDNLSQETKKTHPTAPTKRQESPKSTPISSQMQKPDTKHVSEIIIDIWRGIGVIGLIDDGGDK